MRPLPPGLPFIGSTLEFRSDAFRTMLDWHRRYGEVVRFRLGTQPFHMVSHPTLAAEVLIDRQEQFIKMYEAEKPRDIALVLGQGLVISQGRLWKRQRRLMQPLFLRSRVAEFSGEIAAAGRSLVARWQTLTPSDSVDVSQEMMRATLEVITRTMFSTSLLDRLDQRSPALLTVLRYAADDMRNPLMPPLWLPTPGNQAFRRALRWLDDLVFGLIRERRESGAPHDDLLDKLLNAHDAETGLPMEAPQIRDEVLTIFIAVHETTAVALTWAWYLLAAHPAAQDRLHAELNDVLLGPSPR